MVGVADPAAGACWAFYGPKVLRRAEQQDARRAAAGAMVEQDGSRFWLRLGRASSAGRPADPRPPRAGGRSSACSPSRSSARASGLGSTDQGTDPSSQSTTYGWPTSCWPRDSAPGFNGPFLIVRWLDAQGSTAPPTRHASRRSLKARPADVASAWAGRPSLRGGRAASPNGKAEVAEAVPDHRDHRTSRDNGPCSTRIRGHGVPQAEAGSTLAIHIGRAPRRPDQRPTRRLR